MGGTMRALAAFLSTRRRSRLRGRVRFAGWFRSGRRWGGRLESGRRHQRRQLGFELRCQLRRELGFELRDRFGLGLRCERERRQRRPELRRRRLQQRSVGTARRRLHDDVESGDCRGHGYRQSARLRWPAGADDPVRIGPGAERRCGLRDPERAEWLPGQAPGGDAGRRKVLGRRDPQRSERRRPPGSGLGRRHGHGDRQHPRRPRRWRSERRKTRSATSSAFDSAAQPSSRKTRPRRRPR